MMVLLPTGLMRIGTLKHRMAVKLIMIAFTPGGREKSNNVSVEQLVPVPYLGCNRVLDFPAPHRFDLAIVAASLQWLWNAKA
jgi:hypothetical protein